MGDPKTLVPIAAVAIALSFANHTATAAEPQAQASAEAPTIEAVLSADQAIRDRFEGLAVQDLKRFYLRCARKATEVRVTAGEAATCSIGYDVLLKRHFAGDFEALLAWSRDAAAPAQSVQTGR